MNRIPLYWDRDRLKDVAGVNLSSLSTSTDPDYEFDYLEISNVNYYGIVDPTAVERLRYEDAPSRARRRVFKDNIVISSVRPNLQAVAFIPIGREHFVCSTGFNVVQTNELKLSPRFAYYSLISEGARQYFEATAKGVGYPAVDDKDFNTFEVLLPPMPEQQRIADYLDASCSAIDAAVVSKHRQLKILKELRKSIIAQAVTKGLNRTTTFRDSGIPWFGKIPQHWCCEHLKRLTSRIQTGTTPPTNIHEYYEDGTIPWFAPGSYNDDLELHEPRKYINELAQRDGALRIFPTGTVFLIGIGATIGKIGIILEPASCNQQIIGIVVNHRIIERYLAYLLKIYEDVIPGTASATTLPIFDQVKTGYIPVLAPPLEEQKAICDFLDGKLAEIKRVGAVITRQIDTLADYRKSLIHEYVTGQRRILEIDVSMVST